MVFSFRFVPFCFPSCFFFFYSNIYFWFDFIDFIKNKFNFFYIYVCVFFFITLSFRTILSLLIPLFFNSKVNWILLFSWIFISFYFFYHKINTQTKKTFKTRHKLASQFLSKWSILITQKAFMSCCCFIDSTVVSHFIWTCFIPILLFALSIKSID